jgi:hypothetical protein
MEFWLPGLYRPDIWTAQSAMILSQLICMRARVNPEYCRLVVGPYTWPTPLMREPLVAQRREETGRRGGVAGPTEQIHGSDLDADTGHVCWYPGRCLPDLTPDEEINFSQSPPSQGGVSADRGRRRGGVVRLWSPERGVVRLWCSVWDTDY